MTVDLAWPARLPLPSIVGYGIEDDPNILRSEMESGSARQRQTSTQLTSSVSVQWNFKLFELAIFEAWLHHRAHNGADWFNITYLSALGLVDCEARFQKGKAPQKFKNGALVNVAATLDVRDRRILTDEELTFFIDMDGEALFAAMGALHTCITTQLWLP